jgi:biopolymer transport protein TolQ
VAELLGAARPSLMTPSCEREAAIRRLGVDRSGTLRRKPAALVYNRDNTLIQTPMHSSPFLLLFVGGEIVDLFLQTGAVAKVALLLLLAFSVVSWAVILSKWRVISRARTQSARFMRAFRKAQRMQDVASAAEQFRPSPLVGVFGGAVEEFRRQMGMTGGVQNVPAIQRAMQVASSEEITRLERNVPWLAITGAVTPFIGLFGTVWGIIDAFHGLGTAGAATLRAVAPGVSEALITTAAGLAAAIPAVIAYNLINASIREFAARNDDFTLEMVNLVERQQAAPAAEVRR